jgi:hypothetical protein
MVKAQARVRVSFRRSPPVATRARRECGFATYRFSGENRNAVASNGPSTPISSSVGRRYRRGIRDRRQAVPRSDAALQGDLACRCWGARSEDYARQCNRHDNLVHPRADMSSAAARECSGDEYCVLSAPVCSTHVMHHECRIRILCVAWFHLSRVAQ